MSKRKSRRLAWGVLSALAVARLPLAAEPPAQDMAALLGSELRDATAVQVLLVPAGILYAVTLVDGAAARGRVHKDGCRYVTEDAAALSSLVDILDGTLLAAGKAVYGFGNGGGDLRIGLLFEKDGVPLKALYAGRGSPDVSFGVFDEGWMRLQPDFRERVEGWLAQPRITYVGGKNDDKRPYWRRPDGTTPLPCTTAEMTVPPDAVLAPRPPPASPELRAALDAALRNRDVTAARFQSACEADNADGQFCGCLLRKLPGPYSWDTNGWAAYKATVAQRTYAFEGNPWYPPQKYTEAERRGIFDLTDAATKSCEADSTPPPAVGPVERIGYPPAPPPPPIGRK